MESEQTSDVVAIGAPPWTREEILADLDEFLGLNKRRPIQDNQGGMRAPHMFATWFMARKLRPDLIVESGVLGGQSTWLLEQACPGARLVSIDLNLSRLRYKSPTAIYSDRDFSEHDWSEIPDNALAFFDDHQNAYQRLQQCAWFGFQHIIFEDNYPASQGDCYSLKKAWQGVGAGADKNLPPALGQPISAEAKALRKRLAVYHEFPPIFKKERTRWGDLWSQDIYPTPTPLLDESAKERYPLFYTEAIYYTWICYVRLNRPQLAP